MGYNATGIWQSIQTTQKNYLPREHDYIEPQTEETHGINLRRQMIEARFTRLPWIGAKEFCMSALQVLETAFID